jgi:hypothetical protein
VSPSSSTEQNVAISNNPGGAEDPGLILLGVADLRGLGNVGVSFPVSACLSVSAGTGLISMKTRRKRQ